MKAQIVLLVMALFCAKVRAQQCYQCLTLTTSGEGADMPVTQPGFVSCDGTPEIVDCSITGGCLNADFNFVYDLTGSGIISVGVEARGCGMASDECLSGEELQQTITEQRDTINALLPAGVTFVSGTGSECNCTSNLCNGAPVWKISFGSILLSLLVSCAATKR